MFSIPTLMKSAFFGWLAVNILNWVTLYISNR